MRYRIVDKDYGQGEGLTALPVAMSRRNGNMDREHPCTAQEVLTQYFGENFHKVVSNYVRMEQDSIKGAGIMPEADDLKLESSCYCKTESRLQQPIHETVVDFVVAGVVSGNAEAGVRKTANVEFRVRYILDLRPCEKKCIGPIINLNEGWEDDPVFPRYKYRTNDYLLPILRNEDYETVAHEMVQDFYIYEEYSHRDFVLNGDDLARRMGLTVMDAHMGNTAVMARIYYDITTEQIIDPAGHGHTIEIKPGTILVNLDACTNYAARNGSIVHECSHMYLDRWFFMLQLLTGKPYTAHTNRRRMRNGRVRKNTAVDWMELQCEKLPAYLLMGRENTISFVERELMKCEGNRTPEIMRGIVYALAEHFHVSAAMAKYRLIELGYYEADGVCCYVDGTFIPDHGCSGWWKEGVTYTIPIKDAVNLMDKSDAFQRMVLSGRYMYVEAHFCLAGRDYIMKDGQGHFHLTAYARSHIDECCIAFSASGRYKSGRFQMGTAARKKTELVTDKYLTRYDLSAQAGDPKYDAQNAAFLDDCYLWEELESEITGDFGESVKRIMERKGWAQDAFALELGVSRRALYNYLHQSCPKLEHIIGICVALKLPYYISSKLLQCGGGVLRKIELHQIYRQFLMQSDQLTVSRCNDILRLRKYASLFQGDEEKISETENLVKLRRVRRA